MHFYVHIILNIIPSSHEALENIWDDPRKPHRDPKSNKLILVNHEQSVTEEQTWGQLLKSYLG